MERMIPTAKNLTDKIEELEKLLQQQHEEIMKLTNENKELNDKNKSLTDLFLEQNKEVVEVNFGATTTDAIMELLDDKNVKKELKSQTLIEQKETIQKLAENIFNLYYNYLKNSDAKTSLNVTSEIRKKLTIYDTYEDFCKADTKFVFNRQAWEYLSTSAKIIENLEYIVY